MPDISSGPIWPATCQLPLANTGSVIPMVSAHSGGPSFFDRPRAQSRHLTHLVGSTHLLGKDRALDSSWVWGLGSLSWEHIPQPPTHSPREIRGGSSSIQLRSEEAVPSRRAHWREGGSLKHWFTVRVTFLPLENHFLLWIFKTSGRRITLPF